MAVHQVLIAGAWRESDRSGVFRSSNPASQTDLLDEYPVSSWTDCDAALDAAAAAAAVMRNEPGRCADFLDAFAARIEAVADKLVDAAHAETALPKTPRLAGAELPRTTNQLRLAAAAAREGSWAMPTIDTAAGIRSVMAALGPVAVFGPNNFPFAFNSIAGGDFAAAIAAGCPVIAKANSSHPETSRLFAIEAHAAAEAVGLPAGGVQLIYRTSHNDGMRLVGDERLGAIGYTGSRAAGLRLKEAADSVGKPIYLELSSINPVVILPGALDERGTELAGEFQTSCLMGAGQFCTNPGLVLLLAGESTDAFVSAVAEGFAAAPVGTLLSEGVQASLERNVASLVASGAALLAGGQPGGGAGVSYANTLLRVSGAKFLERPIEFQAEAFGPASLLVVADDVAELTAVLASLEGNLTGCIYSATGGGDDDAYAAIEPTLRQRVGRLLNDRMPTGVAVSPAMNHGGPFPATGHPGFTAVGIPASLRRFAALQCYDNVRGHRLPPLLQDANPAGAWRLVDGVWTQAAIGS